MKKLGRNKFYVKFIMNLIKNKKEHSSIEDGDPIGVPNEPPKSAILLEAGWISFCKTEDEVYIFFEGYNAFGANYFTIKGGEMVKDEDDLYNSPRMFKDLFSKEFNDWLMVEIA